ARRRFLRESGVHIYEYKPCPLDAPVDLSATGARAPDIAPPGAGAIAGARARVQRPDRRSVLRQERYRQPLATEYGAVRYARRAANEPVPLRRAGVRVGLHAKSLVIDDRLGVIGSHHFDPRGDSHSAVSMVAVGGAELGKV